MHSPFNNPPGRLQTCLAVILLATALMLPSSMVADPQLSRLLALAEQRYDQRTLQHVTDWSELLRAAAGIGTREQLLRTNDFFNARIRWTTDDEIYGTSDYWATPLEMFGKGAGDCEDFSIAKYVTLLALGLPPENLRLVYVNATMTSGANQAHMVLAWYESPGATPLILDNLNTALLPANQRGDLRPIFSFNADSLWFGGGSAPTGASPQSRMGRWQRVLNRLAEEGFL